MNNPFDYVPDPACDRAFSDLCRKLERMEACGSKEDKDLCRLLGKGCMIGVLIATDARLVRHTLYAFSGQLGAGGFHYPGFVGPVFDYLSPSGYFKRKELEISELNRKITDFETWELKSAEEDYERIKRREEEEVNAFREKCRESKVRRDTLRKNPELSSEEQEELIRQSQFEKAELRRLKQKMELRLMPFKESLEQTKDKLHKMKEFRRSKSESLQQWLFTNFRVLNAEGEYKSLKDIFLDTSMGVPPSGAGECCAPKLLQAAYLQGLHPESIAEYWYGAGRGDDIRVSGESYPACRGRCLPVLRWMLKGLEINPPLDSEEHTHSDLTPKVIFEHEWFCVVEKPSGMLSVPGKGKSESLQEWLEKRYGQERGVKLVHRLDQDTSGLLIAAFGHNSFKMLQGLFARREMKKTYVAVLDGDYQVAGLEREGRVSLPLLPDPLNRPRQRVDMERGKEAVTDYEFIQVKDGLSRIKFHPHTGRTHQLRIHAASALGLGLPICGDRLYGKQRHTLKSRLLLHAARIEFVFPLDGRGYSFDSQVPF